MLFKNTIWHGKKLIINSNEVMFCPDTFWLDLTIGIKTFDFTLGHISLRMYECKCYLTLPLVLKLTHLPNLSTAYTTVDPLPIPTAVLFWNTNKHQNYEIYISLTSFKTNYKWFTLFGQLFLFADCTLFCFGCQHYQCLKSSMFKSFCLLSNSSEWYILNNVLVLIRDFLIFFFRPCFFFNSIK